LNILHICEAISGTINATNMDSLYWTLETGPHVK
jgi:hypothetical protein